MPMRYLLLLLSAFLAVAPATGSADVREVEPGEEVVLAPDEGLMLVAVDAGLGFDYLRIRRNGTLFDGDTLKQGAPGISTRLYVAPAGRYRFDQIRLGRMRYGLGSDPEFGFEVKPGVINYPGHLRFHPTGWNVADLHVPNRALLAIDWIDAQHAATSRRFEFLYVGRFPDEFPARYREARAKHAGKVEPRSVAPPASGALAMTVDTLWQSSSVAAVDLNDSGDLLAMIVRDDLGGNRRWYVEIIDLRENTSQRILDWDGAIDGIEWAGHRALVVTLSTNVESTLVVVRASLPPGARRYETLELGRPAELVDVIAGTSDAILVATRTSNSFRELRVHRLDISSQRAIDAFRYPGRDALDHGVSDDLAWFSDGRGNLRAALAYKDEGVVMLRGGDGEYERVARLDGDTRLSPLGISPDARILYARTDQERDQHDLVEYDLEQQKIVRTRYSRPGIDVQRAIFDPRRELVGVRYYQDGQLLSEYFDARTAAMYERLRAAFPGRSVHILDRDDAGTQFILNVSGSDQPGMLYHFDAAAKRASELRDLTPWIDEARLAPSTLVRATSADGLAIESYLTLPRGAQGERPLVLYPHGGPIGVRDSRNYRPDVQFLASLGYAVLQVNFRGSEGYGRSFREAARRSYGSRIEDDIDAALAAALKQHALDETRICVVGSSYGGYSGLMSALRWPKRFRCAVSIAGVSDLPLFFTASDAGSSEEGREILMRQIGDPHRDGAMLREHSPLYRVDALDLPLMLVHGEQDLRVDFEHTRRLQRMLNLRGIAPTMLVYPDEGHGIVGSESRRAMWGGIAGFLRQHLGQP